MKKSDVYNPEVIAQVAAKFICNNHIQPIEKASVIGGFAVSFRVAGEYTLDALQKGSAAKGHDILEKTIKPSSIKNSYGNDAVEKWKMVKQAKLTGYVGHWRDNQLCGIYIANSNVSGSFSPHKIYPINMQSLETLESSLVALHAIDNWTALPYTGDYDIHDMITFRGAGRPRTVLANSHEEKLIIDTINREIAKVDTSRPFNLIENNVVRHGPQVNYPSYMIQSEAESVAQNNGFCGAVARPGDFPLAICDRSKWSIINNIKELEEYYRSVGAQIKEAWSCLGVRNYQDTGGGMVKLGRK